MITAFRRWLAIGLHRIANRIMPVQTIRIGKVTTGTLQANVITTATVSFTPRTPA